jgi:hypothetical protein
MGTVMDAGCHEFGRQTQFHNRLYFFIETVIKIKLQVLKFSQDLYRYFGGGRFRGIGMLIATTLGDSDFRWYQFQEGWVRNESFLNDFRI